MQNETNTQNPSTTIKFWVELYSDSMYSWALHKTSSKETAEDLVQETFMVAVQSFDKFEGKSDPKTWLIAILNNKIKDHYRNSVRKPTIADNSIFEKLFDNHHKWKAGERPQEWKEEEGHLLDNSDFQKTLGTCMQKLPKNWLSVIQLKYLEEKNSELICQDLEITTTNLWQILHRAKLQLRKCLELNWFKR